MLSKGYTGTTVILSFLSSHSYLSVHPSLHTTLLSSPIKSICQFLELRLEEMQAVNMHHWGTTAGCPNTCQSGGAFLIITETQLPTHPPHPNHTHIQQNLLEGLSTGSCWPFQCIHPIKAPGKTAVFGIHTMHCQASQQQCHNTTTINNNCISLRCNYIYQH